MTTPTRRFPAALLIAAVGAIALGPSPASAEPRKPAEVAQMDQCVANAGGSGADRNTRIASCCKTLGGTYSTNSAGTPSCQFPDGHTWTAAAPLPPGAAVIPPGVDTRAVQ